MLLFDTNWKFSKLILEEGFKRCIRLSTQPHRSVIKPLKLGICASWRDTAPCMKYSCSKDEPKPKEASRPNNYFRENRVSSRIFVIPMTWFPQQQQQKRVTGKVKSKRKLSWIKKKMKGYNSQMSCLDLGCWFKKSSFKKTFLRPKSGNTEQRLGSWWF